MRHPRRPETTVKISDPLAVRPRSATRALRGMARNWQLYLLLLPVVAYFVVFHYWPMYGVQIAFKDFIGPLGIAGSPWVGFKHFERFFTSFHFARLLRNTVTISLFALTVGFPVPIILALSMNEIRTRFFKKTVQNITYAPHFLSTVVMVGMIFVFLSPTRGFVNKIIEALGGEPVSFMLKAGWFKSIYVLSGVWQNAGWGSVIYMAALAGIDPQIVEAAVIDGASRMQRIRHVMIPGILPTAIVLLILNSASILSVGFEKIYLMQNPLNMESADVISTYVYRVGLLGAEYSLASAVGLFNSVINFVVLVTVNWLSRRVSQTSLW